MYIQLQDYYCQLISAPAGFNKHETNQYFSSQVATSTFSLLRTSKLKRKVKIIVIHGSSNNKANSVKNGAFFEIRKESATDQLEIYLTVI